MTDRNKRRSCRALRRHQKGDKVPHDVIQQHKARQKIAEQRFAGVQPDRPAEGAEDKLAPEQPGHRKQHRGRDVIPQRAQYIQAEQTLHRPGIAAGGTPYIKQRPAEALGEALTKLNKLLRKHGAQQDRRRGSGQYRNTRQILFHKSPSLAKIGCGKPPLQTPWRRLLHG